MATDGQALHKKLSSQPAASNATNDMLLGILQPLQAHMLDLLPVKVLLALRQASSTARSMVDHSTSPQWLSVAEELRVPPQLLPHDAQHGPAVHAVLRDQAALLANIRRARPSLVQRGDIGPCVFIELSWQLHRAGLHLIINELQSCAPDSEGSESDGEHAPEETHEASQLLVVDTRTGLSTRLDEGEDSVGDHPMNVHHAFDCSSGGYLLIGMAEAHSERTHTQQLLLYKLKAGTDGKSDSQQAPAQGAMDLFWQTHLKLRREKGQDPVRPACARSILAWLVGPREVVVIDLATQAEIKRLQVETGSITSLALSESSRYLAVKVSKKKDAVIKIWDAVCHVWLEDFQCPPRQGGQEEALLWSPVNESLLYVNTQDIQVLYMDEASRSVQSYRLDLKTSDLEPENLVCRWAPDGDHIIVAEFDEDCYQRGQAAIFGADVGNNLMDVDIASSRLWPKWPPLGCAFTESFPPGTDHICLVPEIEAVVFPTGADPAPAVEFVSRWTQISGSAHPQSMILVTLYVRDGKNKDDSHCRQPGRLHKKHGCPVGFEHIKVVRGVAKPRSQVAIKTLDMKPNSRYPPQGHPFVMSWLPGTDIYAAAAFNHIWIIDAWHDTQLMCWRQDDLKVLPVDSLSNIPTGKPDKHCFDHGEPSGCLALSFSPDRSSLAWVEGRHYNIVCFGPVIADLEARVNSQGPSLQPQTHHGKGVRNVLRVA